MGKPIDIVGGYSKEDNKIGIIVQLNNEEDDWPKDSELLNLLDIAEGQIRNLDDKLKVVTTNKTSNDQPGW